MKMTLPQTATADAEKEQRLKVHLRLLTEQGVPLGTIIRVKALIAYYKGISVDVIAACYDVTTKSVRHWVKRFESAGEEGMDDRPRSGRPVRLPPEQAAEMKTLIERDNQRVWTARHVWVTMMAMFSVCYSVKYLPELLRQLGLSFHKAVHELIRKNTEKRREWIQTTLPAIYADSIKAGWRIFFQDEVGFQTEGTLAYTWGRKGEAIEIKNYGRHGRVNLIGAFELGTGAFYGVLTLFKVTASHFRRFVCHLKHEMRTDKILLICDNASFHKAKWLREWFEQQAAWLRIEFLPAYSPDFNPIEHLWHWFKGEFTHNVCWSTRAALQRHLAEKLVELPQHMVAMRGVMRKEIERLKTIYEFYDTPFPFPELAGAH